MCTTKDRTNPEDHDCTKRRILNNDIKPALLFLNDFDKQNLYQNSEGTKRSPIIINEKEQANEKSGKTKVAQLPISHKNRKEPSVSANDCEKPPTAHE